MLFLLSDLVENKFESPFSAEKHYEPARPRIAGIKSGHPSTFETLENKFINKIIMKSPTIIKEKSFSKSDWISAGITFLFSITVV